MGKTLEHVMFECLYIFVLDVDIIAIHSAIWQLKYWRTTIHNLCQCQVSNVMVNVELGDATIWRDTWHLIHHPTCTSVLFYIIHRHFCISDKISLTISGQLKGVGLFDIEYKWFIFMVTLIRLMSMSLQ